MAGSAGLASGYFLSLLWPAVWRWCIQWWFYYTQSPKCWPVAGALAGTGWPQCSGQRLDLA